MQLMEEVYLLLNKQDLVSTAEEFSTDWCKKSKSWYSVQKNKDNEPTIETAITCLNNVKIKLGLAHLRRKKFGSIFDCEIEALGKAKDLLETYLFVNHRVASVAKQDLLNKKML